MKKFTTLNVVTAAMLCAVAALSARILHQLSGSTAVATLFSPMHFPILLLGLLCGSALGAIGGALAPLIAFLSSGMPPFPNFIPMVFELAAYGFFAGLFRKIFLKNRKLRKFSSVAALVLAMIAGRIINALAASVIAVISGMEGTAYFAFLFGKLLENFTATWAGIVLQLVLIPAILFALKKGGILVKYLPDDLTDVTAENGGIEV